MDLTEELEWASTDKPFAVTIQEYTQQIRSLLNEMKFLKRKEGYRS